MFFEKFAKIRAEMGYTQEEIAKKLGITKQQYSLYERGKRKIPIDLCMELANVYGVSMDFLLGREIGQESCSTSGD